MVTSAVILAAGLGSRLKEKTSHMPKGFLQVGSQSLIERSVMCLLEHGISEILIGTGYLDQVYEQFAQAYPQIQCIKNADYACTGSMHTLQNMRQRIHQDFLLLESDLLYESAAISHLLNDARQDLILASGETHSNDEVFIQCDSHSQLVNMSKKPGLLTSIDAELVGITKISLERFRHLCEIYDSQDDPGIDYEYILVQSSRVKPITVKKINTLVWCEIDDDKHLARAENDILPKLQKPRAQQ